MSDNRVVSNTLPQDKGTILEMLHQIERATVATYPLTSRFATLFVAKQENEAIQKKATENYAGGRKLSPIAFVIAAIIGLLAFVILEEGLLSVLMGFLFFPTLLFAIGSVVVTAGYKKELTRSETNIKQLDSEMDVVLTQLAQVKQTHQEALALRPTMCPNECSDPKYMRLYISYLETGRADTLKEARNIFDEHLYRERMERKITEQIDMSRQAYEMAERAADAAYAARNAANYAAVKAQQTSYDVRFQNK